MKRLTLALVISGSVLAIVAAGAFTVYYRMYLNPPPPKAGDGKAIVACVGDSITYGYKVKKRNKNSYPARLQKMLGEEYQVLNYGANARTLQNTGDMPYTETRLYKASIEVKPDIVLIMLGSNDSKAHNWNAVNYEQDMIRLVKLYQDLESKPEVYLIRSPAAFENKVKIDGKIISEKIYHIVEDVAKQTGATLLDAYAITEKRPELFKDGVHPDAEGARLIAEMVYDGLRSADSKRSATVE